MNEFFEFTRIVIYILIVYGLVTLGINNPRVRLALIGVAAQFLIRAILLFSQILSPETYREVGNFTSTPSSIVVMLMIYVNMYKLRHY